MFTRPVSVSDFRHNYEDVLERIADAASRSGRQADDVRLIAVSKTFPIASIHLAMDAGMKIFGENRPQELAEKASHFHHEGVDHITWCAIGHVQRNKAREIARYADEFHALDSLRLAEALDHRLTVENRTLDVFVQVNTSHEPQKGGFEPDEAEAAILALSDFPHLRVRGLMTMAQLSDDETVVRSSFAALRELRDSLIPHLPSNMSLGELSMGMSGDFEWAIAEGATSIRVGTAIFGHRPQSPYQR